MRRISLGGKWLYRVDLSNSGLDKEDSWFNSGWIKKHLLEMKEINLPAIWNSVPGLERFEGIIWFFKEVNLNEEDLVTFDVYIRFNAANYHSQVWLNGVKLGKNEGGFLPFRFKLDPAKIELQDKNYLAVRVENFRKHDRIPCRSFDWFNYGGIYRDIDLLLLDKFRIDWTGVKTEISSEKFSKLEINYELVRIEGEGSSKKNFPSEITWKLYYLGNLSMKTTRKKSAPSLAEIGKITTKDLKGRFSARVEAPKPWEPDNPELYLLELKLTGSPDPYTVRFGFREIKTRGTALYLNERRLKIHGICLHEELVPYGRAIPVEERRKDILRIKEYGFNAVRTGHYPHDESLLDIADEEGMLILEEIPVYWGIQFSNREVFRLAAKMFVKMIKRDFNHPSIIQWSAGNEIPVANRACALFIEHLIEIGREIDRSRLFSFVMEPSGALCLPENLRRVADTYCLNMYLGWYYLKARNFDFTMDAIRQGKMDKPWLLTEFGAGAKLGNRKPLANHEKYSEEYQASVLSQHIRAASSKEYMAGWFIWIYRDFKSHMRTNKYQTGFNRKGIVNEKNEEKIAALMMLKMIKSYINEGKSETSDNRLVPLLLKTVGYPLFRLITLIQEILLTRLSDTGDDYYTEIPQNNEL